LKIVLNCCCSRTQTAIVVPRQWH